MASGEPFYLNPTFWVGVSFVTFVGGVMYAKAHKSIATMLDERAKAISDQIDEAKALRLEAENLLTEYQRKQRDAEKEAADMIEQAKSDAATMAEAAKADLANMVARKEKAAEEKIAQAEANAVKEVKAAAVNVAVNAASAVLGEAMQSKAGTALVNDAIKDVEAKLH